MSRIAPQRLAVDTLVEVNEERKYRNRNDDNNRGTAASSPQQSQEGRKPQPRPLSQLNGSSKSMQRSPTVERQHSGSAIIRPIAMPSVLSNIPFTELDTLPGESQDTLHSRELTLQDFTSNHNTTFHLRGRTAPGRSSRLALPSSSLNGSPPLSRATTATTASIPPSFGGHAPAPREQTLVQKQFSLASPSTWAPRRLKVMCSCAFIPCLSCCCCCPGGPRKASALSFTDTLHEGGGKGKAGTKKEIARPAIFCGLFVALLGICLTVTLFLILRQVEGDNVTVAVDHSLRHQLASIQNWMESTEIGLLASVRAMQAIPFDDLAWWNMTVYGMVGSRICDRNRSILMHSAWVDRVRSNGQDTYHRAVAQRLQADYSPIQVPAFQFSPPSGSSQTPEYMDVLSYSVPELDPYFGASAMFHDFSTLIPQAAAAKLQAQQRRTVVSTEPLVIDAVYPSPLLWLWVPVANPAALDNPWHPLGDQPLPDAAVRGWLLVPVDEGIFLDHIDEFPGLAWQLSDKGSGAVFSTSSTVTFPEDADYAQVRHMYFSAWGRDWRLCGWSEPSSALPSSTLALLFGIVISVLLGYVALISVVASGNRSKAQTAMANMKGKLADQRIAIQNGIIGYIMHSLKNPLHVIQGSARLLSQEIKSLVLAQRQLVFRAGLNDGKLGDPAAVFADLGKRLDKALRRPAVVGAMDDDIRALLPQLCHVLQAFVETTPDIKTDCIEIWRASNLLQRHIEDLHDLERLQRGKVAIRPAPTNLCTLIKDLIAEQGKDPKVPVHMIMDPVLCSQQWGIDALRLRQVVEHGLRNALKVTETGAIIVIAHIRRVRTSGGRHRSPKKKARAIAKHSSNPIPATTASTSGGKGGRPFPPPQKSHRKMLAKSAQSAQGTKSVEGSQDNDDSPKVLHIQIIDSGPGLSGLSPEDLFDAFHLFRRETAPVSGAGSSRRSRFASSHTTGTAGTAGTAWAQADTEGPSHKGLGLTISKLVVRAMGGRVWLHDRRLPSLRTLAPPPEAIQGVWENGAWDTPEVPLTRIGGGRPGAVFDLYLPVAFVPAAEAVSNSSDTVPTIPQAKLSTTTVFGTSTVLSQPPRDVDGVIKGTLSAEVANSIGRSQSPPRHRSNDRPGGSQSGSAADANRLFMEAVPESTSVAPSTSTYRDSLATKGSPGPGLGDDVTSAPSPVHFRSSLRPLQPSASHDAPSPGRDVLLPMDLRARLGVDKPPEPTIPEGNEEKDLSDMDSPSVRHYTGGSNSNSHFFDDEIGMDDVTNHPPLSEIVTDRGATSPNPSELALFGSDTVTTHNSSSARSAATSLSIGDAARPHVCVVDDEATNARLAARMLKTMGCDVTVIHCGNFQEQLEALLRGFGQLTDAAATTPHPSSPYTRPVDLVLLDIRLGSVDGVSIMKQLRHRRSRPRVPIVAATASTTDADVQLYSSTGFAALLPKPFCVEDLQTLLHNFVRSGREQDTL